MALNQTQVSQLYVAVFNRASEGEGNTYWQSRQDMAETATQMLDTSAAKDYFGSSLDSNQAFIEHIYLNTLNKTATADPDGIAYWTGLLDKGTSRGKAVSTLVQVIEDYAPGGIYHDTADAAALVAYNQFANRVAVSNYMAVTVQKTPANYAKVTGFNQDLSVTDDVATILTAKLHVEQLAVATISRTDYSIDAGTVEIAVTLNAGNSAFNFTDDATVLTHVAIDNFSFDDLITMSNGTESEYSFSNDGTDVYISFNNQGTLNTVCLTGVVSVNDLVYDQASFESAIGFDAFTS